MLVWSSAGCWKGHNMAGGGGRGTMGSVGGRGRGVLTHIWLPLSKTYSFPLNSSAINRSSGLGILVTWMIKSKLHAWEQAKGKFGSNVAVHNWLTKTWYSPLQDGGWGKKPPPGSCWEAHSRQISSKWPDQRLETLCIVSIKLILLLTRSGQWAILDH